MATTVAMSGGTLDVDKSLTVSQECTKSVQADITIDVAGR